MRGSESTDLIRTGRNYEYMISDNSIDADKRCDRFIVTILGSFPPLRGLSSYCLEFAKAMSGFHDIEFLSFREMYPPLLYPGRDLDDDHSFPSIDIPNLKVKRRLTWYNPFTWIIEGMGSKGKLLHAQWWSLPLIFVYLIVCLCFRLRGKPVVFTVHNVISHERSMYYIFFSKILFLLGNHFIVHTERNKRALIRYFGIPQHRISQVAHGPLDFHVTGRMDTTISRRLLGLNPDEKVILFFGAIRSYKGLETALKAFAKVKDEIPDSRLLIAGKPWVDWTPYKELIEELGIADHVICHLRYIPSSEVNHYFVASDLVILPYNHFDSQSGVGAIALSFRKPLIVTDVGGLPDLVSNPRFLVPPKDPMALAQAQIESLSDRDILNYMSADSEKAAKKMSWPGIAGSTSNIYKKVLKESPYTRN